MAKVNKYALQGRIIKGATFLFLCFIIFTLAVKFLDVRAIGPEGSKVGFSAINEKVIELLKNKSWTSVFCKISEYTLYIAFLVVAIFALTGLMQAIKEKSLKKVDTKLYALAIVYVLMALAYCFFEVVIINYRPVLIEGVLEASYPSSHTVFATTIFGTAIVMTKYYLKNNTFRNTANTILALLLVLTVVGRLLSTVHWLTDIAGGIILSFFYIDTFKNVCTYLEAN